MTHRRRRWAAVVGLVLTALLPTAPPPPAAAAETATPRQCATDEVTIVVDYNELGGRTRFVCAAGGGRAASLFEDAGFTLEDAATPGMQGFVCRVNGRPENGPCTGGDAYWSLWWAGAGNSSTAAEWSYATLGVRQLELEPGSYLGFAWHEGNDAVAPPDVEVAADGALEGAGDEEVAAGPGDSVPTTDGDDGGPTTWLLVGGAVVVLGAAAVVPLRRRRQP